MEKFSPPPIPEVWYLGRVDGVLGAQVGKWQFQVLRANDPMVVEYRQVSNDGQRPAGAEIDGEAWAETGRNYHLRRVELTPTG